MIAIGSFCSGGNRNHQATVTVRVTTQLGWVPESDRFRKEIEAAVKCRVACVPNGRRPAQDSDAANQGALPL